MAADEIEVKIATTADTSGLTEITSAAGDAQHAVDGLATAVSDTSGIEDLGSAAGDTQGAVEDLGTSSDDTKSKAQALAEQMVATSAAMKSDAEQAAVDLQQKLSATQGAVDALGSALGSEFVADLEGSGGSVDALVAQFESAGLTMGEIEADAETLASAVKTVADNAATVPEGLGLDGAKEGLGGVGDAAAGVGTDFEETGAKASATGQQMGRFVGQGLTELPVLGGALGPLKGGLAQVTSQLGAGEGGMKKMLAGGLALGAVAVVMGTITSSLQKAAAIDAWKKDQVEAYSKAIKEGGDQVAALVQRLADAGKIESNFGGMKFDIAPIMAGNGVSVDMFARAVEGGKEGLDSFEAALKGAGVEGSQVAVIMATAAQQSEFYGQAQDKAAKLAGAFALTQEQAAAAVQKFLDKKDPVAAFPAEFQRIADAMSAGTTPATADLDKVTQGLGITLDDAISTASKLAEEQAKSKASMDQAKQSAKNLADQNEATTASYQDQVDKINDTLAAEKALIDAHRSAADAGFAVTSKTVAYNEALAGLLPAIEEAHGDQTKIKQAYDSTVLAAADLADANTTLAEKQAAANGETLTATQKQDLFNQSMLASASTATGPMREAILAYIADANGIPTEKATAISAAIEAGDIETATRLLNEASADRDTAVQVDVDQAALDAAQRKLDDLAKERIAKFGVSVGGGTKAFATGTPHAPRGLALIGDDPRDPGGTGELMALAGGETVYDSPTSARMLNDMGGDGQAVVVQQTVKVDVHVYGSVQTERDLHQSIADGMIDLVRRGVLPAGFLN